MVPRAASRIVGHSLKGYATELMEDARRQLGPDAPIKVGFVEGSKVFDLASHSLAMPRMIDLVSYEGEGFHKHASADNVILHAAMVHDGFRI